MPIQDRKYFILKHNAEQEESASEQQRLEKGGGMRNNGDLNSYARLEQSNRKNGINNR